MFRVCQLSNESCGAKIEEDSVSVAVSFGAIPVSTPDVSWVSLGADVSVDGALGEHAKAMRENSIMVSMYLKAWGDSEFGPIECP